MRVPASPMATGMNRAMTCRKAGSRKLRKRLYRNPFFRTSGTWIRNCIRPPMSTPTAMPKMGSFPRATYQP